VKLPNAQKAVIDREKLAGYLLSRAHPLGRFKAPIFARMGYWSDNCQSLADDLRAQHLSQDARPLGGPNEYGVKYEIRAPLQGPIGRARVVVSIWIVRINEDVPRFVTAYPARHDEL